ncbi:fukutin-related protein-like [Branchiostoma floridae]|uniref:Ribitol-5-phosphate transferase n=1 Tax=Branchiostoma floridae TaxID=7739 RepID=A0A9J7HXA5_BRAFL|nr:fukutin-related protein-like [Branchiostoma floridae]
MRLSRCQCILIFAVLFNAFILCCLVFLQLRLENVNEEDVMVNVKSRKQSPIKVAGHAMSSSISDRVTVVIREFEDFENHIVETVKSILHLYELMRIVIVVDKAPYPPLTLPEDGDINVVSLKTSLDKHPNASCPEQFIDTEFVLFLPDGAILTSPKQVEKVLSAFHSQHRDVHMVAAKVGGEMTSQCFNMDVNLKQWTLTYQQGGTVQDICHGLDGSHIVLMRTGDFRSLSRPYQRPFPQSLFIQTALQRWKVAQVPTSAILAKKLFTDPHNQWKHQTRHDIRLKAMYEEFGIKKVSMSDGRVEWHGCRKETPRCFGTVVDDTPEYLYENRWTPPCCLQALQETGKHVFLILEKCGARYWLEGGSLLGAARHADIIPWDYDIDLGIYKDDIDKCPPLNMLHQGSHTDSGGFVWEKATEGEFYRIQYSAQNHLHVDIWPFHPQNGVMTRGLWTQTHRQDIDFPEHFLVPLRTMKFLGMQVSVPNDVKGFLELKFGKGVIENPQYPQPNRVQI